MTGDADTLLAERLVALDGARNFRDFGGYPAADGRIVRRGRLYRANRLSRLSADDCRMLDNLGIRTIFDLRARHEREADPTAWTGDHLETHVFRPGHKRRLIDMAMEYPPTAEGAHRLMIDFYAELPRTMAHVFGEVLQRIANGAVPCVIHCSAGKDRTGMAAALVLAALGVSRDVITADYALTSLTRQDTGDQARAVLRDGSRRAFHERFGADAVAVMMAAKPAYIAAALDAIDAAHGSMDVYLDSLGTDEAMREKMRGALLHEQDREGCKP